MTTPHSSSWFAILLTSLSLCGANAGAQEADLILHHGKIVTADRDFSVGQALAVTGDRVIVVGTNEEVLKTRGPRTAVVDLGGKMVLPGLIDSHTHPTGASLIEFDHPIPEMETIQDVLDYIRSRADALGTGRWIVVRQVFITRLKERRYPTRAELDRVAPENPVLFSTGPDASLNSLALKLSGIDRDFRPEGPGKVEKDPRTGEPTGILRNLTRYVKVSSTGRKATEQDQDRRLIELFKDYNSVGITAVIDRDARAIRPSDRYERLRGAGALTVRLGISRHVETLGPLDNVLAEVRRTADHPLRKGGPRLRIVGIKTFLDGGMLTGSAYMREPWGVSRIYAIDDPTYRGVLFIPPERLLPIVRATVESGLQFTAHSVGDGAVHALLDAYEEVNKEKPVAPTRPCITHSNFMSREAIEKAARLGVLVDIQPVWLYLDTRTLVRPVRVRPAAVLPAAPEPLRGRGDRRGRLRPHAEDRLAPFDQPLQPVPGDVGRDHPPGEGLPGSTPPRGGPDPGAGDPLLHDQQRPLLVPGGPDRIAGAGQAGGLRRHRPGPPDLPGGPDQGGPGPDHVSRRQTRLRTAGVILRTGLERLSLGVRTCLMGFDCQNR